MRKNSNGHAGVEQTLGCDHATERPRRVGAAAEADDEYLVARNVVARDEGVAAHDAGDQAGAERAAEEANEQIIRTADTMQILRRLLHNAIAILQHPLLLLFQQKGAGSIFAVQIEKELENVGRRRGLVVAIRLAGAVPSPISAEDDVFAHD